MELHASCAGRDGVGVLLLGSPGAGKSDLLFRLLEQGFSLVADDRVVIEAGMARARVGGEGLLEVRGLGILRLPYLSTVKLGLAVRLSRLGGDRLPWPTSIDGLALPAIDIDPGQLSAASRLRVAVDCLMGRVQLLAGFAVA